MDQNRILSFDEFVSQHSTEQMPHSPEMGAGMELPHMHQASTEMPIDGTGTAGEELPMDPNAEPVVPELPHHEEEPVSHSIEEPNMPTQNITETFKKYGNKHAMPHTEAKGGKCKYCHKVIANVGSGDEPKPGMCEDCYSHGGDE